MDDDLSDSTTTLIYYFKSLLKNKKEKDGYICYYSDEGDWILEIYNKFGLYNFEFNTREVIQHQYDISYEESIEMIKVMVKYLLDIDIPSIKFRSNREVLFIL